MPAEQTAMSPLFTDQAPGIYVASDRTIGDAQAVQCTGKAQHRELIQKHEDKTFFGSVRCGCRRRRNHIGVSSFRLFCQPVRHQIAFSFQVQAARAPSMQFRTKFMIASRRGFALARRLPISHALGEKTGAEPWAIGRNRTGGASHASRCRLSGPCRVARCRAKTGKLSAAGLCRRGAPP